LNFKYLSLVFLCLLVLGSFGFSSSVATGGTEYTVLINGTNCEGMNWIFENQTIKSAEDIDAILKLHNCINGTKVDSVKQFTLGNKTFIEIAPEAKLTTLQNSPTRKYFFLENGSLVLSRKVLNNIDTSKNTLLDCDILSCTWKTEITPAQTMRLKPEDISGGFQFGQATYSAPYYLKNETYNVTIAGQAIYEYSNFTDENGTARTISTLVGYENSTTEQRVRTVKDYDISSLIMEKGKTYIFYIDFQKSSPTERVDIYDTVLGVENKELAWWNNDWNYYLQITVNNTAGNLQNATLNITLNTTNFNYSHSNSTGKDIRILNSTNSELSHFSIWAYNSNSSIYFMVPSLPNGTSIFYLYYGNPNASAKDNESIFAHRFYGIQLTQILNMHSPRSDEYRWLNSSGGNVSPNFINENPTGAFGFNLYDGTTECSDKGEYFNTVGQYHNVSYNIAQVFTNFSAHNSFSGARGGVFNISFSDNNATWYFITNFTYSTTSGCVFYTANWTYASLVIPITPSPNVSIGSEASATSIVPSILNSTNGTYFTVSTGLYGWVENKIEGLTNISYTWWNGTNNYSSGAVQNLAGHASGIKYNIANISSTLLNINDVWILQINGTNGTTNISNVNSSSITITNTAPTITNVSFTSNGSSYQLGPVQLNFSATDLDTNNITYFVNWFLNGTNITAYAQTGTMLSGATVNIAQPASVFNLSDNWYARVWVTDGTDTTPYNNTHNTTIQNYFSNVTAYAPQGYSHIYTPAYINFTLAGAANASAYFVLNTSNSTMANNGSGNAYTFRNLTILPPNVTTDTNYSGTWFYRAILANGSYYELNTSQTVNINISGFFICNATLNTTTMNYSMFDSFTLAPVNTSVSILTEWAGDDGVAISKNIIQTGVTVRFCITPSTFNRQSIISESITASGYLPSATFRVLQNYSANVTERIIYMTNSTSGSVYTFQTLNQFGGPISGATVTVMQGSTTIFSGITDETGSVLAPLTELNIYQVIASATGYSNSSFNFVAGATTTIPITLVSTSASNITAPNYQEVFNEVQFTIAPTTRFFSSPTNITYTISSPNSTLWSWGFFITSNGTVVNTQTSTTTTGGSLYYTVNQTGTYILNIWFKADGFANYTPPSYFFTYGNTSGVSTASENLQTGSIISGFGFYLLAVIFAMMGALWVSQYSPEGAAIVGLLILCAFTFMWSDAIVLQTGVDELGQPTGITSLMATGFVLLTTLSAFYLRQYGA
jgi:hypothetical protein